MATAQHKYASISFQQFAAGAADAAQSLTPPEGASRALIQAETQDIRFRSDGTAPTATIGVLLKAGAAPYLYEGDLNAIKVISAVAGAVINIEYQG